MISEILNLDSNRYNNNGKVAGCYNIGKTIGKGHFAVVKEAKHVFTQEKVAIKIIDKTKLDDDFKDQLLSEVMCMKLVQHPNIVRLYEVIDTVSKMYLVIELGDGGDLYDYILKNGSTGLNEHEAKHYFRQILHAISYCHKLHVVHRDLKPENVVFFKQTGLLKLTDFGFSNKFTPGETLKTSCGSLAYSAPEILLGDSYDAPKVDIWSLGVILYLLVVGVLPFDETNDSETVAKIMDCNYSIPKHITMSCANLIRKMLVKESGKRSSLDEIISDEWLALDTNSNEFIYENYKIPLITQHHLNFEEHLEILSKMSDGRIATVNEIQEILDNEIYNHISATYFLLAERKLKRKFIEEYKQLQDEFQRSIVECSISNVDGRISAQSIVESANNRRISMILESEEMEEEDEEIDAMASLSVVREELERFMPKFANLGEIHLSGVAPPNPSRCTSRINSINDLCVFLSDEYDSDTGSLILSNRKLRKRGSIPQISQEKIDQLAKDYVIGFDEMNAQYKSSTLSQIPENNINNPVVKKSLSSVDVTQGNKLITRSNYSIDSATHRMFVNCMGSNNNSAITNNNSSRKQSLHQFRRSRSTTHSPGNNIALYRHFGIIASRRKPVVFDTGSPCASSDSDEPRHTSPDINMHYPNGHVWQYSNNKKYHLPTCNRSKSFDANYRLAINKISNSSNFNFSSNLQNNTQLASNSHLKHVTHSWNRNSISQHLAESNFSLSSFVQQIKSPNLIQIIRGTYELQKHNIRPSIDHINETISKDYQTNYSMVKGNGNINHISKLKTRIRRKSETLPSSKPFTFILKRSNSNDSVRFGAHLKLFPDRMLNNYFGERTHNDTSHSSIRSIKDRFSCCLLQ